MAEREPGILERHDSNIEAHPAVQRRLDEEHRKQRHAEYGELWNAIQSIRSDTEANTRWRYVLIGGLTVLSFEITLVAGVLLSRVVA